MFERTLPTMAKGAGCHLTLEAEALARELLAAQYTKRDTSSGNARLVRNFFERAVARKLGPAGLGRDGALEPYLHPHVLVIDELGYLSHAADTANVLYRVVNERYLAHRPMLLTTNKPLAALGEVLHDGDLAEAILDRLLERGALRDARPLLPHPSLD